MNKMVIIVAIIGIFMFVLFSWSVIREKDVETDNGNKLNSSTDLSSNEAGVNSNADADENVGNGSEDGSLPRSAGGGGVGGGGGGGSGSTGDAGEQNPPAQNSSNSCILVRPGNFPDVSCSVDYIKSTGVSLKIRNEFGSAIQARISLTHCSPEINKSIANNQEEHFVFSCDNLGEFIEEVSINYVVGSGGGVNIGGFVVGNTNG